jgi:aspartyl-tRNA(Asn)/glutamyl-tRNA(Gln) amidotransferase subunit C
MADTRIDINTVKRVAKIARIDLTEEEIKKFTEELSSILDAFKELDKVDTKNIQPSFHPQELKNVWREDKTEKFDWQPLANTKHKEGKYFKGPRIV